MSVFRQIGLLIVGTAVLLAVAALLKPPPELALPIATGLPGGIIAIARAASVKAPRT
jgi:hypothetical protein